MPEVLHESRMRIPLKGDDYFCQKVNSAFEKVQERYLEMCRPATVMRKANAMLGDGTVTQTDTFDPQNVQTFYQRLTNQMEGWLSTGVSKSDTDDLRRLFCQFTRDVGKYYIYGYFGIQFHAIPYYKVDRRVLEIQKELANIADNATTVYQNMTGKANKAIEEELKKKGLTNLEFQELFDKMFDDEKLVQELDKKASFVEGQFPEFEEMGKRKNVLFIELNDLQIELYQTTSASLDFNRLMQGEEGLCTYFDIEMIKGAKTHKRESIFETEKIPKEVAERIAAELLTVVDVLQKTR